MANVTPETTSETTDTINTLSVPSGVAVKVSKGYQRKTTDDIPANPSNWPAKLSRIQMKTVNALIEAGLADAPTVTRQQLVELTSDTLKYPWWVTRYVQGRGIYTNPCRFVTTENPNKTT